MKINLKTSLSLILIIVMFSSLLCACNTTQNTVSKPETSTPDNSNDVSIEESTDEYLDNLPDINYGGDKVFTIYSRTERKYEFEAEELNDEFINDKIYERNAAVEERFGVKINTDDELGEWGVHDQFINSIRTQINGGTAEFDVIAGYAAVIPQVVSEGIFYDWYEIENIDFSKKYWSQDLIEQLTVNNKMFLLTGDISLTMWQSMMGIYYNKTEATNVSAGNLYELVNSKKWTFDKMTEIAVTAARNLDDSNPDDDFYGYVTAKTVQIDIYLDAFNIPVISKKDDTLEFTVNNIKTHNTLQKLYDFICVGNTAFSNGLTSAAESMKIFAQGNALFTPDSLQSGETLKNYDIEYGILPMPLYDENQEMYHTTCQDYFSAFVVPNTNTDTEFTGIMMEALCSESSRNVVNQYYEIILKSRYTHDDESKKMIDIIREGVLFNFGYLYSMAMGWPAHQLNICINEGSTGFQSKWEENEGTFISGLDRVLVPYYE